MLMSQIISLIIREAPHGAQKLSKAEGPCAKTEGVKAKFLILTFVLLAAAGLIWSYVLREASPSRGGSLSTVEGGGSADWPVRPGTEEGVRVAPAKEAISDADFRQIYEALLDEERYEELEAWLRTELLKNPQDEKLRVARIETLGILGREAEALRELEDLLVAPPFPQDALAALFSIGGIEYARQSLETMVASYPEDFVLAQFYGRALIRSGFESEGLAQLERAVGLSEGSVMPKMELAVQRMLRQEYAAAAELSRQALDLAPAQEGLQDSLRDLHFQALLGLEDWEGAGVFLEAWGLESGSPLVDRARESLELRGLPKK